MLTALTIKQFTLVESMDVEFSSGLTTITGETGAGKSLVLDALGLALGDRGDTDRIRLGAERAEVCASFAVSTDSPASQWLTDNDLDSAGDCLLRRILTRDGRSRGYINGQPATMTQLRTLGVMLIDIHHQHEHQSLLAKEHQRTLLDEFGGHQKLLKQVAEDYKSWHLAQTRLADIEQRADETLARKDLLTFQSQELIELDLQAGEIEALEQEQSLLANADTILFDSHQVLALCDGEAPSQLTVLPALSRASQLLSAIDQPGPALKEALSLLDSAHIQVEEALGELQTYIAQVEPDPARLQRVEDRLSSAYQLARKHKVKANELPELCAQLRTELVSLCADDNDVDALTERLKALAASYQSQAKKLSASRKKAAKQFEQKINQQLQALAMADASLQIALTPLAGNYSQKGLESVELLISTNPGQAHRSLNKVASGGELSRVSLAIQVVAAHNSTIPVLVFDEVDVGIGGATAETVGKLLRELGDHGQVICISHLPQVASCAHHHLLAKKQKGETSNQSHLVALDAKQRIAEIARMLGGEKITAKTRSHAEEMLGAAVTG
ncbi:MAG: DNA repair protein RecN [Gammaproteobacteria bacterium]|nr:DNA repair protein RecN [Gammaproteobacteria bacterium]MBQ0839410.1 DNA repair protein RecN [Gammaproteobacteria bacterium]